MHLSGEKIFFCFLMLIEAVVSWPFLYFLAKRIKPFERSGFITLLFSVLCFLFMAISGLGEESLFSLFGIKPEKIHFLFYGFWFIKLFVLAPIFYLLFSKILKASKKESIKYSLIAVLGFFVISLILGALVTFFMMWGILSNMKC